MRVYFVDEYVYLNGRPSHYACLQEGERVHCRAFGEEWVDTVVSIVDGNPMAPGFEVERWGEAAVLRAAPRALARAVCQSTQTIDGVAYTVTATCEANRTAVWLDGGADAHYYLLPQADDAEVRFSPSLLAVAVAAKRGERRYLIVLQLVDGNVLYEGWVDEFAIGDELEVVCTFEDMKKHTRRSVYGYRGADFCLYAHTFSCANAHTYIDTLVPYLFAEALCVGATDEARGYLSADLADDFDMLLDYIGPVVAVRRPPIHTAEPAVGIVGETGRGNAFVFEMTDGRIADVRRLDD